MAGKKNTAAPAEEPPKAVETAPKTTEDAHTGVDLADAAVGNISDEIVVVNADGGLNLRTGPHRSYPVKELLEDGTLLAVLELPHSAEVLGWALVHTGQHTGWVDCSFLQALKPEEKE